MSLPAVTNHLKVLEKAGLITKTREAQWRPCKINGTPLRDVRTCHLNLTKTKASKYAGIYEDMGITSIALPALGCGLGD